MEGPKRTRAFSSKVLAMFQSDESHTFTDQIGAATGEATKLHSEYENCISESKVIAS